MGVDFDGPEFHRLHDAGTELDPVESPLLALMAKLPPSDASASKIAWLEDECFPRRSDLTRPLWWWSRSAGVEHPEWFRVGDVLRPLTKREKGREAVCVRAIVGGRLHLDRRVGSFWKGRRRLRARSVYIVCSGPVSGVTRITRQVV